MKKLSPLFTVTMQKPLLVALDTNFPLLLADGDNDALDALEVIKSRMRPASVFIPPTAIGELIHQSEYNQEKQKRLLAQKTLDSIVTKWNFTLVELDSVQERLAEEAAHRMREVGIIPDEERNDAAIVAESAVLNTVLLVSNDSHLLHVDHRRLGLIFRELDLPVPLIVSPREIVKKFYR